METDVQFGMRFPEPRQPPHQPLGRKARCRVNGQDGADAGDATLRVAALIRAKAAMTSAAIVRPTSVRATGDGPDGTRRLRAAVQAAYLMAYR